MATNGAHDVAAQAASQLHKIPRSRRRDLVGIQDALSPRSANGARLMLCGATWRNGQAMWLTVQLMPRSRWTEIQIHLHRNLLHKTFPTHQQSGHSSPEGRAWSPRAAFGRCTYFSRMRARASQFKSFAMKIESPRLQRNAVGWDGRVILGRSRGRRFAGLMGICREMH